MPRRPVSTRLLVLVALALSVAACGDLDPKQEGFPCNPDGGCRNGLVCVGGACMLPVGEGADGGFSDGGVSDAGPGDAGTDGGIDAGPGDAGPEDGGPADGGADCRATGADACTGCDNGTPCDDGSGEGRCLTGVCVHGCLIHGVSYAAGASAPGDACRVCDPSSSMDGWSDAASGTACADDGNDCTPDQCSAGVCTHEALADGSACGDDGNPCTEDRCEAGQCVHAPSASGAPCGTAGECDGAGTCSSGCEIGGVFYPAGAENGAAPCQRCEPSLSETAWSPMADGTACADDGEACTTDRCAGGACAHAPRAEGTDCGAGRVCDAAGACTAGCFIGDLLYGDGVQNPANPCEVCDPVTSTTGWTARPDDTVCGEPLADTWSACTFPDVCATSGERSRTVTHYACASGVCDASDALEIDTFDCLRITDDVPCSDDGNACTADVCAAGTCDHPALAVGTPCGTGLVCDDLGGCSAGCVVGGTFYVDGTVNPANPCEVCVAGESSSAWTTVADGTGCDDGDLCNGDHACSAGACVQTAAAVLCDASPVCHTASGATCDPASGACTYPAAPDGSSCGAEQVCHQGTCSMGCWIDGAYRNAGQPDPLNSFCARCDPTVSTTSWTPINEAGTCSAPSDFCHDGVCTRGCGIGGTWYPDGTPNPANPCEVCDASFGFDWTPLGDGASCDDGDRCNGVDTCQAGSCVETTAPVLCDSPPSCHTVSGASCDPATGTCSYPTAPDGMSCQAGSQCCSGSCVSMTDPCNCGSCGNACLQGTYCDLIAGCVPMTCFVAGTPVRMADGSERAIEAVAVGEEVLAYDTDAGALVAARVTETFAHGAEQTEATVLVNGHLRATPNHPFYAGGRWVRADALVPGDVLLVLDAEGGVTREAVWSVEARPGGVPTYNLEVAGVHDYFAGGVLVHNKPPACRNPL